ncbi:MAG: ATP-binding cassette domain-containing protein [Crocinitomicaceae bacterium]|nr:ATP-binding cassette domain-containing protein [Crocinitomicaceae bacterium]
MEKVIAIHNGVIRQQERTIVKGLDFELAKNEIVFLIGKTGSGKSSVLKLLYGELPLEEGTGNVVGFDLNNLKKKEIPSLRRKIGIVFQDFQLLTDRSVYENLAFVLKATGWTDKNLIDRRIQEVLTIVSLKDKINTMPFALSGGEQQRITIARALLNKPELILADEPTGNLDPETSEEIMRVLISIAAEQNTGILMATHDMSLVDKFPNKVLRVENGTVKQVESLGTFDPFTASF